MHLRQNFVGILPIDSKSWPYSERLHARISQPEQWRIVDATPLEHPMHLHGFHFHVNAVGDGETEYTYTAAEPRMVVTEPVPGNVRERQASLYAPAGPGFFLEGVSKEVEPVAPLLVR